MGKAAVLTREAVFWCVLGLALINAGIFGGRNGAGEEAVQDMLTEQTVKLSPGQISGDQSEESCSGGLSGFIRIAGSTSMEELTDALAEAFMDKYPEVTVTVEFVGSSAGAEAVLNGSADIGNLSRNVSPEEAAQGLIGNTVADCGIAICVDPFNLVTDLTKEQLRDIYTGRIRYWKDVGGDDLPIVVVGREAGSGTREAFEELLGLEDKCAYANEMDSTGAVMARVARTPGAIGYLSFETVNDMVRTVKLEGTEPAISGVKAGEYALVSPYIMATKGEIALQSPLVQAWFLFVYSREGQEIVETILAPAAD